MTPRGNHLAKERLRKLDKLRLCGIDAYPHCAEQTHTTADAIKLLEQINSSSDIKTKEVIVCGRIMAQRDMGKLAFSDLQDTTGKIQLFIRKANIDKKSQQILKNLDVGDFISAKGQLMRTNTGEPSIDTNEITILSKSILPLPEKWHGLQDVEIRFRQRYLDLISNIDIKNIFMIRSKVITEMRRHLDQKGFIEVETPILQGLAGGALAKPFITHYNALNRDFYLRIALELHLKRLIIGGFDRVYEIGRCFRNEGISSKHNPEFTMLECYQAYANYNHVMVNVETMVSTIVKNVTNSHILPWNKEAIDFKPPWPRIPLQQAIFEGSGIDFQDYPDTVTLASEMKRRNMDVDLKKDRGQLIDQLLSDYVEPNLTQPTFLIDYPIDASPLSKAKKNDKTLVERFEAFAGGMEIANAFTELNDPIEQRLRFSKQLSNRNTSEESEQIDEDFLNALEYGMPPTGGLGMGIDRLVMLLTNKQAIREVILFPQLKEKL
jgi:lysyl-tRNA synthetase class 2